MGRSAGEIGAAIATGRQHHALRAEAMDGPIFQAPGGDTAAHAFIIHDQVKRDIFNKELAAMLQGLLIERMQNGVPRAVSSGAGAHRGGLAVILHMAAKGALIDAAIFGAAERHAVMFKLDHRRDGFAAHIFDGVLIPQPVRPLHGVIHVPAPIIFAHIAKRGANAALGCDRVATCREDLGDAGGLQPRRPHAESGAQPGATSAHHHHIIGMVHNPIGAIGRLADRIHCFISSCQAAGNTPRTRIIPQPKLKARCAKHSGLRRATIARQAHSPRKSPQSASTHHARNLRSPPAARLPRGGTPQSGRPAARPH